MIVYSRTNTYPARPNLLLVTALFLVVVWTRMEVVKFWVFWVF